MNNWIDDGFGNKWHRCKLGADCGLKVIEAGKARCWCQDQEASRCEVQAARDEIAKLEAENERLREDKARLDWFEDWGYGYDGLLERGWGIGLPQNQKGNTRNLRSAIDAARKEAQP